MFMYVQWMRRGRQFRGVVQGRRVSRLFAALEKAKGVTEFKGQEISQTKAAHLLSYWSLVSAVENIRREWAAPRSAEA